ncbi:MAG: hypothetical protein ABW098_04525 [Candidatus Thiodiazotropha sp.]
MGRADRISNRCQETTNQRVIAILGSICLIQLYFGMPVMAEQVDETLPSGAFLEFLADWEDENGAWQDPLEYQEMELDFLDQRQQHDDE